MAETYLYPEFLEFLGIAREYATKLVDQLDSYDEGNLTYELELKLYDSGSHLVTLSPSEHGAWVDVRVQVGE